MVAQEGMGEAGQAGLGLASLNNFRGLSGGGAVARCLLSGPGAMKAGEVTQ